MKPVSPSYDWISGILLMHFSFKERLGVIYEQGSGIVETRVFWTEVLYNTLTVSCNSCMAQVKGLWVFLFVMPQLPVSLQLSSKHFRSRLVKVSYPELVIYID